MLMYRDMNPRQRRKADRKHQETLLVNKQSAEWEMADWDCLSPEERAYYRRQDELQFKEGGIDPLIELDFEWG